MKTNIGTYVLFTAIVYLLFLFSDFAVSQETQTGMKEAEIRGYFMFGGGILDFDALNNRLEELGYSSFSKDFGSLGAGILYRKNSRWLVGAEGHYMITGDKAKTINNASYKSSLTAAYAFLDVGYAAVSTENFIIYPLMGLGGGAAYLQIGKSNFNEILENPQGNAKVSHSAILFNFALGTEYLIKLKKHKEKAGGIVFGFRAGYGYALWKGWWTTDWMGVKGGPKADMSGPYLRLMIGLREKSKWWEKKEEEL